MTWEVGYRTPIYGTGEVTMGTWHTVVFYDEDRAEQFAQGVRGGFGEAIVTEKAEP